jgi:carbohydrate-selective porin OprB
MRVSSLSPFGVDLQQILQIRGMSAYVGGSWGTGSNLASTLNSSILTNGLYAPSFYLGEMYLQQKFLTRKLSLRGGRLAASNAFAALLCSTITQIMESIPTPSLSAQTTSPSSGRPLGHSGACRSLIM